MSASDTIPIEGTAMVRFIVNGETREADVPDHHPLLWVLRETFGLQGTKFGCGGGYCGACTVLIDGQPFRSCRIPVGQIEDADITTIEGLSSDGTHPVQLAWVEEQVPQCGYCQSGQIMAATGLLAETANPTDADIDSAMAGNVCRCGTYSAIRRAIHLAAEHQAGATATDDAGAGGDEG